MDSLLAIDGATGGGQILRSALSLSMVTGRPFAIERIRARRPRPGLMRQHLTAVRAAAAVCGARVRGDELGATELEFHPGPVQAGSYQFAVGSAGSTTLVLQTVLPALMVADAPSELTLSGGTHNPLAPPYPVLDQVFFPALERMGVGVSRTLDKVGFQPSGGGTFRVRITPARRLTPLSWLERGALRGVRAEAHIALLPHHIAQRELAVAKARLGLDDAALHLRTPDAGGPGNVLLLVAEHEHATEVVTGFGERDVRAERVAGRAVDELARYLAGDAPVGEHLADQLLIPLAMAGGGTFRTLLWSDHARSNAAVITQFLPVAFALEDASERGITVRITPSQPSSNK